MSSEGNEENGKDETGNDVGNSFGSTASPLRSNLDRALADAVPDDAGTALTDPMADVKDVVNDVEEDSVKDVVESDVAVINPHELLSQELLREALPKRLGNMVTEDFVDRVNGVLHEPELRDSFRDNLLGFSAALNSPRFTLDNYILAVKYVSFKLRGDTNLMAYIKTHPARYQELLDGRCEPKSINGYVRAYNANKLVVAVFEESIVPTSILNADKYQDAINEQHRLMLSAKSEKVRSDAASSLMSVLKPNEVAKVELDIGIKEDQSIIGLKDTLSALADQQRDMIAKGQLTSDTVAGSELVVKQIN